MASLVPGYEYDIFISYRQKDNKHLAAGQAGDGWVTQFVTHLKEELDATFKQDISIYFDVNPHDGLGETHHVDKSLEGKLRCLILIPIISRTYCDPDSFAWQQEFLVFRDQARADSFGLEIKLANRNVASRVLPVQIHELSAEDQELFERENGGPLRPIPFVFKSQGVNRPLSPSDSRAENSNKTLYRDQINKTANAVEEIIGALKELHQPAPRKEQKPVHSRPIALEARNMKWLWSELVRRNVFRAGFAYLVFALALRQLTSMAAGWLQFPQQIINTATWILLALLPVALGAAWLYEMSPDGFIRTNTQQSAANPFRPSQKKPLTGALTAVVIVLLVALVFIKPISPTGKSVRKSIAVVPFVNRSENPHDEYRSEGLTEELINRLTVLRDLEVFRAKESNIQNIHSALHVQTVLTGSIQVIRDTIRLNVQLVEAPSEKVLWSTTFVRNARHIMTFNQEIAKRIAGLLELKMNEIEKARLEQRPTEFISAYDYFFKGRKLYKWYDKDSNNLAIKYFRMALVIDPYYAHAWAGLADAYSQVHTRFGQEVSWTDSSLAAGKMAVSLDSTLSDSYKALANGYAKAKWYDSAILMLKKALKLDPNNTAAIGNLGTDYMLSGNLPEALRWEKRAVLLDPKNPIPHQIVGWIYRWMGDLPNAELWLERSLALDKTGGLWDNYELLAYCLVSQGRKEEALALIPKVAALDTMDTRRLEIAGLIAHFAGDKGLAKKYFRLSIDRNESYKNDPVTVSPIGLGQILLEEGQRLEAELYLDRTLTIHLNEIKRGSMDDEPPFNIAGIYAIRGDREKSLEWLKKAIDSRWIDYAQFKYGPWFIKYRNDPEFLALMDSLHKRIEVMRAQSAGL